MDNFVNGLIASNQYTSFDDVLNDSAYIHTLVRYHVLNSQYKTFEFPFGTFSQPTLSNDFLNVNIIFEQDSSSYEINREARVVNKNIKASNGFVHTISAMLTPITMNSYNWLKNRPSSFSIMTAAIEATGYDSIINVDMKLKNQTLQPFTLLIEPDSIFKKVNLHSSIGNISSFEQLANAISPNRTDYRNSTNPLNIFVGYHILTGSKFLNELQADATNYGTFADIPLFINGKGLDIIINPGKYDFMSEKGDSTSFVGLLYDQSNVNTQSGAIHFVNQIMEIRPPFKAEVRFGFEDEPAINEFRKLDGAYLIDNHDLLNNITWSGADLSYVKVSMDAAHYWVDDYLEIVGDFKISYTIPKVTQGKYDVFMNANSFNEKNAVVEVTIDGQKIGGLVDLTKGGNASNPFYNWGNGYPLGPVDFKTYKHHTIEIKSLIPGIFIFDFIKFVPIK